MEFFSTRYDEVDTLNSEEDWKFLLKVLEGMLKLNLNSEEDWKIKIFYVYFMFYIT